MKSLFFVMKNIPKKPIEETKQIDEPSIKTYFNLVKSTVVILTIKNRYLSLYEPIMPKFFLTHHFCLILSEIKERYKNKTLDYVNISKMAPNNPIPYIKKNYFSEKLNFINDTVYDLDKEIKINLPNNFESSSKLNGSSKNNNNKFLNNKRIREDDKEKYDHHFINKKNIFSLDKIYEKKKITNVGRKKKNSGEYGPHNKFSNDNMMRKLKNKVIESARKLISKKIKEESQSEFKEFHKIGGEFSQELNIKFNFWFYFQKLKDIFQYKCSPKYKNNFPISNKVLIETIFSEKNNNKFNISKKLLEMPFCQYYHEIFLGENKDWKFIYQIPANENFYDINFFIDSIRTNYDYNPQDDELYIDKIIKLADDYESFFLKKNPRNYSRKEKGEINEKTIEIKAIIENLDKFDKNNEELKFQFLLSAVKYKPDLTKFMLNLNKISN